jgi:hypothetical protein
MLCVLFVKSLEETIDFRLGFKAYFGFEGQYFLAWFACSQDQ